MVRSVFCAALCAVPANPVSAQDLFATSIVDVRQGCGGDQVVVQDL